RLPTGYKDGGPNAASGHWNGARATCSGGGQDRRLRMAPRGLRTRTRAVLLRRLRLRSHTSRPYPPAIRHLTGKPRVKATPRQPPAGVVPSRGPVTLVGLLRVVVDQAFDVGLGDADLGQDLVGGGGPDERLGAGVPVGDVVADLGDQSGHGGEGAAP